MSCPKRLKLKVWDFMIWNCPVLLHRMGLVILRLISLTAHHVILDVYQRLPSGAFHDALSEFLVYFEMIRKHLWDSCKQLEPKEEDYHKLFDTLIFAFDQLLAITNENSGGVRFVDQSGQVNVEVKEPTKKQKTEHTPHGMVLRKRNLR